VRQLAVAKSSQPVPLGAATYWLQLDIIPVCVGPGAAVGLPVAVEQIILDVGVTLPPGKA
jgi:hypothetical protein